MRAPHNGRLCPSGRIDSYLGNLLQVNCVFVLLAPFGLPRARTARRRPVIIAVVITMYNLALAVGGAQRQTDERADALARSLTNWAGQLVDGANQTRARPMGAIESASRVEAKLLGACSRRASLGEWQVLEAPLKRPHETESKSMRVDGRARTRAPPAMALRSVARSASRMAQLPSR